jgi:peptidoglycan/LPS O-acetylase OafA/YrhL
VDGSRPRRRPRIPPWLQAALTAAYILVVPELWYGHVPYLSFWPLSLVAFLGAFMLGARASRSRLPRMAADPRTSWRLAAALGMPAALLAVILTGDRLPWWRYAVATPLFGAIIGVAFVANRRVPPLVG